MAGRLCRIMSPHAAICWMAELSAHTEPPDVVSARERIPVWVTSSAATSFLRAFGGNPDALLMARADDQSGCPIRFAGARA